MAYNPIDEKAIDKELQIFLSTSPKKTATYNAMFLKWRERFKKNKMNVGKKIEILATYADYELTLTKKNEK